MILHLDTPVWPSSILTEQLVCPAVEWLTGSCVLVLFIVLDWPEVSQGPHEAPEVYLVLSENQRQNHVTKQHIIQRKQRIYYNIHNNRSHHRLCWLRLPFHSLAVTDTMKSQTSRNPTPFYRIRSSPSLSSSCSEANKPKLEQENTSKTIKIHS